ncbi:MAG: ATP-binding protein [Chloroflexi bacterium]|nr:ATP-binding protein [Chloroflexota bacterium]
MERQAASDAKLLADSLGQLPEPEVQPAFVVVSGLPGSGKSYFCRKLAERAPFLILESDVLRKALFPRPSYTPDENTRLFQGVHHLIEDLLKRSIPVILDATNLSEQHRERLYSIAERLDARLILVRVEAPQELVRERLTARTAGKDRESRSEAGWNVYQKMRPAVQKIRRRHYVVDTSRDITPVIDKIVREIEK